MLNKIASLFFNLKPKIQTVETSSASLPVLAPSPPSVVQVRQETTVSEVPDGEASEPKFDSQIFYQDLIEPYKSQFLTQGAFNGIVKILELLDKHGNCPSIVTKGANKDSEIIDICSIKSLKDIFLKVTLKDHSYRVARIAVQMLKDQNRDYENFIPKMVTAALGHDIGKIPILNEGGLYETMDHPVVSATKVKELFNGEDIYWLNNVLDAIWNHHRASDDQFATLLRQADHRAREIEVVEVGKELSIKPWAEWFNLDRILEMARTHINLLHTGNKCEAFSFRGTVYCQPDFIYELTKMLAKESKIIDMTIACISEKEVLLRRVANSLRQKDFYAIDIREGYYGMMFNVDWYNGQRRRFYFIPIKIEAFGVPPNELERAKEGYLKIIKGVTISTKRRTE